MSKLAPLLSSVTAFRESLRISRAPDVDDLKHFLAVFNSINTESDGILQKNAALFVARVKALVESGVEDFLCSSDGNCSAARENMFAHSAKGVLRIFQFEDGTKNILRNEAVKLPEDFRPESTEPDSEQPDREIQFLHWLDDKHLLAAVADNGGTDPQKLMLISTEPNNIVMCFSIDLLEEAQEKICRDVECWPFIKSAAAFDSPHYIASARGYFEIFRTHVPFADRIERIQSFYWDVAIEGLKLSPDAEHLVLWEERSLYVVALAGRAMERSANLDDLEKYRLPERLEGQRPIVLHCETFNENIVGAGFRDAGTFEVLLANSGLRIYQMPRQEFFQLEFPQWPQLSAPVGGN